MIVHGFCSDAAIRKESVHRLLQGAHVTLDPDIQIEDQIALGIEEKRIGLTDRLTQQIGAGRRADHGVGHFRIGDQHIRSIDGQVDDRRLVERELQHFRCRTITRAGDIDLHGGRFGCRLRQCHSRRKHRHQREYESA